MNSVRQRPLSLGGLRAFEAVARRLNFSEAAEEMHVTQSAVSRQIKGLEDELGAPLFTRGTRRAHHLAVALAITGVSALIALYSIDYLAHDRGVQRYFATIDLFVAAMLRSGGGS